MDHIITVLQQLQLQTALYDKRRSAKYQNIDIKQYTHAASFLPANLKSVNTAISQTIRFSRLLTDEHSFHLETALCLLKLVNNCAANARQVLAAMRKVIYTKRTRYNFGNKPKRPAFHYNRIRILFFKHLRTTNGVTNLTYLSMQLKRDRDHHARGC